MEVVGQAQVEVLAIHTYVALHLQALEVALVVMPSSSALIMVLQGTHTFLELTIDEPGGQTQAPVAFNS
jgi:hypothetical protein